MGYSDHYFQIAWCSWPVLTVRTSTELASFLCDWSDENTVRIVFMEISEEAASTIRI